MGGSLEFNEIINIIKKHPEYRKLRNFIETGTYKGYTSRMVSRYFERVYTIEIVPINYWESRKLSRGFEYSNIDFYLGDSLTQLPRIMGLVKNTGSVYFIDAHQSGSDSGNNGMTVVPLLLELDVILQHNIPRSLFIFDDIRFWKGHPKESHDWLEVSEETILSKFKDYNYTVDYAEEENDRFFVLAFSSEK